MMETIGICVGASTVSFVRLKKAGKKVIEVSTKSVIHNGNPKSVLAGYNFGKRNVVVTGRKFKDILTVPIISEPEAIETAFSHLGYAGKYQVIASLGGETFMVYEIDNKGFISNVITGNKCASGTGEFFLQQIRRMDLPLAKAVSLAAKNEPYHLSGRCSVFCKSDCTHALNKGTSIGRVTAGLSKMISDKIVELLSQQRSKKILVIGGVAQNKAVIKFLKRSYPKAVIPKQASYFEAYGAALHAFSYGKEMRSRMFQKSRSNFTFLPSLKENIGKVTFKEGVRSNAKKDDTCLLGLDVGSTTTKAVIIRKSDDTILASIYLRTNGDPVGASVKCYKSLKTQINVPITIEGLGVTGSGRHIAGLHALTDGIINEIIAHAKASAYYDKDVDTIFEIGGQDAKYTYLTNGVASDYAMNEACSAGTGSFLEESAQESLDVGYKKIAAIALRAKNPPNFNDQCAAFISSDIKNALQEGISKTEIIAGLVYSICMNYYNRVKGNRSTGKKILMQGGVCYNKAVPVAMSVLVGKEIVVPPDPGLMGAFGVALEVKERIGLGLMKSQEFKISELISRKFDYKNSFVCKACDRACEINVIEVDGKSFPFGGACSKYYNQRLNITTEPDIYDFVKRRQEIIFDRKSRLTGKTVGISRSFLTNTLYPMYHAFFTSLGFRVVLSDTVVPSGVARVKSSFCYPVELSHGMFEDLVRKKPDYIFLPHVTEMANPKEKTYKRTCVFVQAESYYLSQAFSDRKLSPLLTPVLNFADRDSLRKGFISIAKDIGKTRAQADKAFRRAERIQEKTRKELLALGKEALLKVESGDRFGMVLFGRPYNSFAKEANMGIPHKFASKGIVIIPHDILPSENIVSNNNMYWYMGQLILRNAIFVRDNDKLFGTFITNFSCGPDSFLVSYFRRIMGMKPSLTLELDSHSSDAGVETRIDAAIDIISSYRELKRLGKIHESKRSFRPLRVVSRKGGIVVVDPDGKRYPLTSDKIEVILPSMGRYGTEGLAAVFRHNGINAVSLGVPTMDDLKAGRAHTSCKECLPYILTTGQMIDYRKKNDGKKYLFFMPHGHGPCRQGQYHIKLADLIDEIGLEDTAVLSLNDENSYGNMGTRFFVRAWIAMIVTDALQDIENALLALAVDKEGALNVLDQEWDDVRFSLEHGSLRDVISTIRMFSLKLKEIPLTQEYGKAMKVSLIGEVYVRREEFSRIDLIEQLAAKGFVVKVAPVAEYIYYTNYLARTGLRRTIKTSKGLKPLTLTDKIKEKIKGVVLVTLEKKVKSALALSGLYEHHLIDVEKTIAHAKHLINPELLGESILTIGLALREIVDETSGVISIGPFACMPSRVAESVLSKVMTREGKEEASGVKLDKRIGRLPFLTIETDGNPYPQIIQSKVEIFMLQAERLDKLIR